MGCWQTVTKHWILSGLFQPTYPRIARDKPGVASHSWTLRHPLNRSREYWWVEACREVFPTTHLGKFHTAEYLADIEVDISIGDLTMCS